MQKISQEGGRRSSGSHGRVSLSPTMIHMTMMEDMDVVGKHVLVNVDSGVKNAAGGVDYIFRAIRMKTWYLELSYTIEVVFFVVCSRSISNLDCI